MRLSPNQRGTDLQELPMARTGPLFSLFISPVRKTVIDVCHEVLWMITKCESNAACIFDSISPKQKRGEHVPEQQAVRFKWKGMNTFLGRSSGNKWFYRSASPWN